ncbi:MAG: hypothetical protein ABSG94_11750 [Brevinematales bacterium]
MITYAVFMNGEETSHVTFVIKTNKDPVWGDTATMYEFLQLVTNMRKMPGNYTNFDGYHKVSLDKASLVEETRNWEFAKDAIKGFPYYQHYEMNTRDETYEYTAKTWNGIETRESRSRISLKNKMQYPIWTTQSLVFIGARFLDRDSTGIVYLVEPQILKEPMPIRIKFLGREEIATKAGRFKTIKGTMLIADVFIGRLLDSYTKNMAVWIEESSGRVIKIKSINEEDYLISISVFTNER